MDEIRDDFTGLISQVITDPKDEKLQPMVEIIDPKLKDDQGQPVVKKRYFLPKVPTWMSKMVMKFMLAIFYPRFREKWPELKMKPILRFATGRRIIRSQAAKESGCHFRN